MKSIFVKSEIRVVRKIPKSEIKVVGGIETKLNLTESMSNWNVNSFWLAQPIIFPSDYDDDKVN